jgi:Ca-activated chloride channel family protein
MIDLAQFHFLRPLWLLAALPACALAVALWRTPGSGANWRRAIAPELLDYLLEGRTEQRRHWPWLALAGWLLGTLALAGPTWEKLPQPVLQKRDALVVVLDLSLSMYAEDVQPSRLQRARFKILDVLQRRQEGLTGLVVYSGDAHVVSPLTDDTATIANLVPALAPDMMPVYGSDPVAGIDQALQLLRNAGFERGRILLLSDGISDANIEAIAQRIDPAQWQLSILGVGTAQGAPIPIAPTPASGKNRDRPAAAGGFLKQVDGQIVVAQLHGENFEQLAGRTQGRYRELQADDRDLDALLPDALPRESETRAIQREFDRWRERGPWLAMALLPLAALAFRRGWLLALLLLPLITLPGPALAAEAEPAAAPRSLWRDLWQRPDQQAQQALQAGDAKTAAAQFRDPAWRGAAQYRAGDFEAAAQTLQGQNSFDADYNRGNALARAGHLQEAIAAYDAALQKSPDAEDAKANRALVENLLRQQQQQPNQQNQQNQQQQDKSSQDSSAQSQGGQSQDDQSQNSQSQDQQSGDNQSRDGQSQDQQSQSNQAKDQQSQNQNNQAQQNDPASSQGKAGQEQHEAADSPSKEDAANQQAAGQSQSGQENAPRNENADRGEATQGEQVQDDANAKATGTAPGNQEQQRQQHATEQWLRQIPDDPSGLLRRKFLYEHRQRERTAPPRDNEQPQW